MKPALLVIDVQKQFFGRMAAADDSLERAIKMINNAIVLFREQGWPIYCIQNINQGEGLVPGSAGFDLPETLAILPADPHIHKTHSNSFYMTPLEELIKKADADTVIVTGYAAEFCVLSTYRAAVDLDLNPIILRGAIASPNPPNIPFVENINDLVTLGALKKLLV